MLHQPSEFAASVLRILDQASSIVLKYFQTVLDVEFKRDEFDPLTIADKESDYFIRNSLHELFPHDLLLSEENPLLPETYNGRVWMIDPLDGTKSFIKGSDTFSINIGLVENGVPIFGCVAIPAQGKVFYAKKGKGAFRKTDESFEAIHTSSIQQIEIARLITREGNKDVRPIEEKLNTIPFRERITGGGIGEKLCKIAEGVAEAQINTNRACKWDTAGVQVILEEAGGIITDFDNNRLNYKSDSASLERSFVACSNKELHEAVIKELIRLKV